MIDPDYAPPYDNIVYGSLGGDTLNGTSGTDFIAGRAGDDSMFGFDGDDELDGGDGNDWLEGGAGNDTLIGGTGVDTASYINATQGVYVDLVQGTASDGMGGTDTLTGIENLYGSNFGDILLGNAGDNGFYGNGGDDWLIGLGGNDWLNGGAGDDTLEGDDGNDTLLGGDGNDSLGGDAGNDVLDGGSGMDKAYYAAASGSVYVDLTKGTASGGDGNDTLISIENVIGSAFGDTLIGNAGNNVLGGGAGNDVLEGSDGNDTLIGGAGNDTVSYIHAARVIVANLEASQVYHGVSVDTLSGIENVTGSNFGDFLTGDAGSNALAGNGGDDRIDGRAGDDILYGGDGNDTLIGGDGNDTASGGEGNDVFVGETAGNDMFDGGNGFDTADYSGLAILSGITVNLLNGTAFHQEGTDSLISIEAVIATAGSDTLVGDDRDNTFWGGAGNDTVNGGEGNDVFVGEISGNDIFDGGNGTDMADYSMLPIYSGIAVNLLTGTVFHEEGTDTLYSIENVKTGAGNDTLTGDFGDNILWAGAGDDTLFGAVGNDTLYGEDGDDYLDGGSGNSEMYGGDGNDIYLVHSSGDHVYENSNAGHDNVTSNISFDLLSTPNVEELVLSFGIDSVTGAPIQDAPLSGAGNALDNVIAGNNGANHISGLEGKDFLYGALGDDVLDGGAGNDRLFGGDGNDMLYGGGGGDMLYGAGGGDTLDGGLDGETDRFWFQDASDSIISGMDAIYNFTSGVDKIDLQGIDANTALAGDQAFVNGFGSAYTANGVWIASDLANNSVTLYADVDGDPNNGAEFAVRIVGIITMTSADIVF